ncbi:MAG: class I SAM-dependent methyltransferase [Gammaproteobacteria bacterium]|nr:class I SAM-dependent methyltransferase [Gammaproteobacteria bacterium]
MKAVHILAMLLALPAAQPSHAADARAAIGAAVADKSRTEADSGRDGGRKPAETLAFAGVKPRSTVIELIPGGGYYTRLLSKVVGPHGHLYALVPAPRADAAPDAPDRSLPIKAIAAENGHGNVSVLVQPIRALRLPAGADLVWTSDNYHDVKNVKDIDMLAFNKSVFDALKPGGHYLVIDHAAAADAPADVTDSLHRIRAATVKEEVRAAGFVLEGESDVLHNAADNHELKVFDPAIRGKTDQFVLMFVKPGRKAP